MAPQYGAASTKFLQWHSSVGLFQLSFSSGVLVYPASIPWVSQWYPSVHWVNQWHSSGILVYTGPASVPIDIMAAYCEIFQCLPNKLPYSNKRTMVIFDKNRYKSTQLHNVKLQSLLHTRTKLHKNHISVYIDESWMLVTHRIKVARISSFRLILLRCGNYKPYRYSIIMFRHILSIYWHGYCEYWWNSNDALLFMIAKMTGYSMSSSSFLLLVVWWYMASLCRFDKRHNWVNKWLLYLLLWRVCPKGTQCFRTYSQLYMNIYELRWANHMWCPKEYSCISLSHVIIVTKQVSYSNIKTNS